MERTIQKGDIGSSTIILETVVSYDLWTLQAFWCGGYEQRREHVQQIIVVHSHAPGSGTKCELHG
jgi:hypothetical protein